MPELMLAGLWNAQLSEQSRALIDLAVRNKLIYGNIHRDTEIPEELADRVTALLKNIESSIEQLDEILTDAERVIQTG